MMRTEKDRMLAGELYDATGISYGYLIGCLRHFSYGIRIGEVRVLSPTPAMIMVGLTASPSVM